MKKWELNYGENVIVVENRATSERLYVNGELQDETLGLYTHTRLWGQLPTGEIIKVFIGGWWTVQCRIFINNKLQNAQIK